IDRRRPDLHPRVILLGEFLAARVHEVSAVAEVRADESAAPIVGLARGAVDDLVGGEDEPRLGQFSVDLGLASDDVADEHAAIIVAVPLADYEISAADM